MTWRFVLMALVASSVWAQPAALVALADCWAEHFGVPRELVRAVIEAESNWNPRAVSPAGAIGLMQLMPDTAAAFRVRNRFDPAENIRGGVAYLAFLMEECGGDLRLVVGAYNALGSLAFHAHDRAGDSDSKVARRREIAMGLCNPGDLCNLPGSVVAISALAVGIIIRDARFAIRG